MSDIEERVEKLEAENKELREIVKTLAKRVGNLELKNINDSQASPSTRRPQTARTPAKGAFGSGAPPPPPSARTPSSTHKGRSTPRPESAKPKSSFYFVGKKKIFVHTPECYKNQPPVSEPAQDLVLEYAYGYNGKSARDNLYFINDEEIVYCLAGAGVVFNPTTKTQRHFLGHNEDIMCLAKHKGSNMVASGQSDPKGAGRTPFACVWDCTTMEELYQVTYHERAIIAVGFNDDASMLVTIGEDNSHVMAIWDLAKLKDKKTGDYTPLVTTMTSKDRILGMTIESKSSDKGLRICTYGDKNHLKVHTFTNGSISSVIPGSYKHTNVIQKAYMCAAFSQDGGLIVGAHSGHIYVFDSSISFVQYYEVSKTPVGAIQMMEDGGFAAATQDGKIQMFNAEHAAVREIDMGKARACSISMKGEKLAVGCKGGQIYFMDGDNKELVMEGHTAEIWGLAVSPISHLVAIAANDKHLRIWDYKLKVCLKSISFSFGVRSASFSFDGSHLVVGCAEGSVVVLECNNDYNQVYSYKVCKEQVDVVCFSPTGKSIACGSWDQRIALISCKSWKVIKYLTGHTSSITHLNWSDDGTLLMSNSKDIEALYWDVTTGKRIDLTDNVVWDKWACILGWPVQGVFWDAGDATDINAAVISGSNGDGDDDGQKLVATGDDTGHVSLYKFPCVDKKPAYKRVGGHSAHVTNVRFSHDSQYLFSVGGGDLAAFQWAIK